MNRSSLQGGTQSLWCMPGQHRREGEASCKRRVQTILSSSFSWAFRELGFNRNEIPFPASSHSKSFWHRLGIPTCISYICLHQAVSAPHHCPARFSMSHGPWHGTLGSQTVWRQISAFEMISICEWQVRGTTIPEILGSERFRTALVWAENTQH